MIAGKTSFDYFCLAIFKKTIQPWVSHNMKVQSMMKSFCKQPQEGSPTQQYRSTPRSGLSGKLRFAFSSYRRADRRRLALALPVITLITRENDNNTGSLMTEVIVVEVPRYAAVVWWMTAAMHRAVRRLLLHGRYLNPFVMVATFLWGCCAEGSHLISERRMRKSFVCFFLWMEIKSLCESRLHLFLLFPISSVQINVQIHPYQVYTVKDTILFL